MEIKIITAFYDIGRSKWSGFERTPEEYFEAFKSWSLLKNEIVVYTYPEMAKKILSLERENIAVVTIELDALKTLHSSVYQRMKKLQDDESFLKFRRWLLPNYPENNADYNFIMAMKAWFIYSEANREDPGDNYYAWMDFGFNHQKSNQYPIPEEFDQLWANDKLKESGYFFGHNIYNIPNIFEVVRSPGEYAMGGLFLIADRAIERFFQEWQRALWSLLDLDLMDDDQTILLIVLRNNPDFVFSESDWCLGLKQLGCKLTSRADIRQFSEF